MQQTKRRSKKGVILLALAIALLVVAIAPAAASAAPNQLKPSLDLQPLDGGGVFGQGHYIWFGGSYTPAMGEYYAEMNHTLALDWAGIPIPTPPGGTLDVGTLVWKLDGKPAGGNAINVVGQAYPYPVTFGDASGSSSSSLAEGIHTVESWLKETTATAQTTVEKPIITDMFGVDNTPPEWQHFAFQNGTAFDPDCFYNIDVKFGVIVSDPYGSGVAATPTVTWTNPATTTASVAEGYRLAWDYYTWEVTGTALAPSPSAPTTGNTLSLEAYDMVGNGGVAPKSIKFDVVPPTTSYSISPAGADTQLGWTNKDVTVTFKSADGAPTPNSGVAYTEYIKIETSGTAVPTKPAIGATGTQGTSVTVTHTAPVGPVYVYYRSVDKACPSGNKEDWNLVMVFIDKTAPALSDDTPSWWINKFPFLTLTDTAYITLTASDHNSGLAAPGIKWSIAGHPPIGGTGMGPEVEVPILPLALGDGIRELSYSATDKAGNEASMTASIKIDTRGPVTDGATGWVNGLVPYELTATDQVPGSGVAATVYRVDQATPWKVNEATATAVAPTLVTPITLAGGQGAMHTIDFASVDAALPFWFDAKEWAADTTAPSWHLGNWELDILNILQSGAAYKSRTVKLDVTAPVVTAMDPKNGEWQKGPATINFSGTDVGAGYAYTEWKTSGSDWTKGEVAQVGGNGEITVTYHGVDKVGIVSADQTIMVKVASTGPSVVGANASAKKGHKATFKFNVTSVTPQVRVIIQIRTKSGRTVSTHNYANVTANSDQSRSFKVNFPKGKYNIRISAVDQADNNQTKRGTGTLTVK
jgi:hypothetical protein